MTRVTGLNKTRRRFQLKEEWMSVAFRCDAGCDLRMTICDWSNPAHIWMLHRSQCEDAANHRAAI